MNASQISPTTEETLFGINTRLRVVPLSLSPSFRDAKENRESKVAARNPGGEERAKGGTTA